VNKLVIDGKVDPCLSKIFKFDETGECHQLMRDNKHPSGNMAILVNAPRPGLRTLDEVRKAK
jgi:crotonyl-CoA carboxylase/reductase